MNPEDIGRILDEVGERIGPAGEYAWQVGVQHTAISAWAGLILPIVALVIALPMVVISYPRIDPERMDGWGAMLLVSGFVSVVAAVAFIGTVGDNLPDALVPEWAAIERLLGSVKGE